MELSEEGGQSAKQPKDVTPDGFTYQALLKKLKADDTGWLAWSWWPDSCLNRNIGSYHPVTQAYEGLRQPYGSDLVDNPDYGLRNTTVRVSIFE